MKKIIQIKIFKKVLLRKICKAWNRYCKKRNRIIWVKCRGQNIRKYYYRLIEATVVDIQGVVLSITLWLEMKTDENSILKIF